MSRDDYFADLVADMKLATEEIGMRARELIKDKAVKALIEHAPKDTGYWRQSIYGFVKDNDVVLVIPVVYARSVDEKWVVRVRTDVAKQVGHWPGYLSMDQTYKWVERRLNISLASTDDPDKFFKSINMWTVPKSLIFTFNRGEELVSRVMADRDWWMK